MSTINTSNTITIPVHQYPHKVVNIIDNTERIDPVADLSGLTRMLFVFTAPKGRDMELHTLDRGLQSFIDEYGYGPFATYGQPLLNAHAAIRSNEVIPTCLRVTADDATYANLHIVAVYSIEDDPMSSTKEMKVRFEGLSTTDLTDLDDLASSCDLSALTLNAGETAVHLFSVGAYGRGKCGLWTRLRINTYKAADKLNFYKNYFFEILDTENGIRKIEKKEEFAASFTPGSIYNKRSNFVDDVVADVETGASRKIRVETNYAGFEEIFNAWLDECAPDDTRLTLETFDPILGINKFTDEAIENFFIDSENGVILNKLEGLGLDCGSDGAFDVSADPEIRKEAIHNAYLKAFRGLIDEEIFSTNKYPLHLILDADYDNGFEKDLEDDGTGVIEPAWNVKRAIAALVTTREDCVGILDMGILSTKSAPLDLRYRLEDVDSRLIAVETYHGKIKDPYSYKTVKVTGTYALAYLYPRHFQIHNGKHVSLAGYNYGILSGIFLPNSIAPVYDDSLDSVIMDKMHDARLNMATVVDATRVKRLTDLTRQSIMSDLSDLNNMMNVLDIKRDCQRLADTFEYNFMDGEGMSIFKQSADNLLLTKYQGSRLRSIEVTFSSSEFESERGILHMTVDIQLRRSVKTTIIDINVNK